MSIQPLVALACSRGGLGPDDLVACLAPLFRQVIACHSEGLVAPLRGIDALAADDRYRVRFDPGLAHPPLIAAGRVAAVQRAGPTAVEVVARSRVSHDLTGDEPAWEDSLDVVHPEAGPVEIDRPVLVSGWQTWEHLVGHHDELTDLGSLGLLLAALALGLDLGLAADAHRLARHRGNLFALKPDLHPVIARLIEHLVAPDRSARLQDLPSGLQRLEDYRDQPVDFSLERVRPEGTDPGAYRRAVLETLRDRLFDLTRRNRLLYFRSTQQSLNLTEASVPLLLDARNLRAEQLCTWNPRIAGRVLGGKGLPLGSVIRWNDAPYAAGGLDAMIAQARRDRSEYGQSQLRLIVAFFRWHELKAAPQERIASPLLLLPVELTKRRGVRDSYQLQAAGSRAEVNPALRQQLDQLYGIDLPESVDLAEASAIAELHAILAGQIAAGEPGVTLTVRDRPRIELIHQRARLRFDSHQRRTGRARTAIGGRTYAYSYRRRDYRPLGLQIFRDRVADGPAPAPVQLEPAPEPVQRMVEAVVTRDSFVLDDGTTGNPYAWEIDLCAVTLANLNYRTMSLVRDYRELIARSTGPAGLTSAAFDRVFAREPRRLDAGPPPTLEPADRHRVVPADGSQVAAVARARAGDSFVIQGPPGTGKSQTITNLVADYVAQGRRVLFVCQKRAAIDVVHARLQQQGLGELTCLIHDSQADKKQFVLGLKASYEAWLAAGDDLAAAQNRRARVLAALEAALAEVSRYEAVLATPVTGIGPADPGAPSLRTLVERLVRLTGQRWGDDLPAALLRLLPTPGEWWAARPAVRAVAAALSSGGAPPALAGSPLRFLATAVLAAGRPEAEVLHRAGLAAAALRRLVDRLGQPDLVAELDLRSLARVVALAGSLAPLARRGRAGVLRRHSGAAEELDRDLAAWCAAGDTATEAAAAAAGWQSPPAAEQALADLAVARRREGSPLRWFHGDWRRVRALVRAGFSATEPTTPGRALELLVAGHRAAAELARVRADFERDWGYPHPPALLELVERARRESDPRVAAWRDRLADPASALEQIAEAAQPLEELSEALDGLLTDVERLPLLGSGSLAELLDALAEPGTAAGVRGLGRPLLALHEHPAVIRALRRLPAGPDGVEYAVCAVALAEAAGADPGFDRFDGAHLRTLVARIQRTLPDLRAAEAALLVSRVRSRFVAEALHAQQSLTGMSGPDRQRKQAWTAGRRVLEHEFGKVQRYRSIRELASGESGAVVAALRPVWLMSPSSVSDTLPLDPDLFDVVIYDEASQIPVEEAVPAMHRAGQVIVVGDRMQLPPTQYFAAGTGNTAPSSSPDGDGDDGPGDPEERDEDEIGVVLDGDSFLAQSAVRLPATMLTWHYRSRFEALIAFSNELFYDGRLAVVPDLALTGAARPDLVPDLSALAGVSGVADLTGAAGDGVRPADVVAGVDALLARSISLHRTSGAVYRRRANPGEAMYVAELVREFLGRGTGLTLGVVAFSQAQQGEIERALERLAGTDDLFARRYEAELARKDGEQAVGLFVKNLENVQGDERDVMIMSVCYAPGPTGRMLMNFGPINTRGGEKRLNVIVSRARRHMAVVSTIEAGAITNTYNDGANTLRRFLAYAQAVSRGDAAAARIALGARPRPEDVTQAEATGSPGSGSPGSGSPGSGLPGSGLPGACLPGAADHLTAALRERGLEVGRDLGESSFRVDLAIRRPGDQQWRVAVLLDTPERVAAEPLGERLTSHPAVLAGAGWRPAHVLVRDWLERPDRVVADLVELVEASDPVLSAQSPG